MKVQFSIAGVMGLTLIISLGLWSLLYSNQLVAHLLTASLLAGGGVGWIVGASYGRARPGCIAGVLGALPWTCAAVLLDLHAWGHAHRFEAWGSLAVIAALGAVPMASTVAVYDRSPRELIVRPTISCIVGALIAGLATVVCLGAATLLYIPRDKWLFFAQLIGLFFSIEMLVVGIVAALVGAGYGLIALLLRGLETEGRKYRDAHHPKSIQPETITAVHKDPASVDRQ